MVIRARQDRKAPTIAADGATAALVARGRAWPLLGLALSQLAAGERKLDPQTAAKMYLALVGVVVAGIGLLTVVALWGARARRLARQRPQSQIFPRDAWARKPLVPPEQGSPAADD